MVYEGDIYRPPSEADSLLLQVSIGCTWNRCTFCGMYKNKRFRARPLEEITADLRSALHCRGMFKRVFLCDGDALALPTPVLAGILAEIKTLFPETEGVRSYASARNILGKSAAELRSLAGQGLDLVYIGLESGSDKVLSAVNKGNTKAEIIAASALMREAGLKQSVSIIAGLAGAEMAEEHMRETADALNQMQPDYLGMLVPHESEWSLARRNSGDDTFQRPSPRQVLTETRLLLENLDLRRCYFTSAHASNYFYLRGQLPGEKDRLLAEIARS